MECKQTKASSFVKDLKERVNRDKSYIRVKTTRQNGLSISPGLYTFSEALPSFMRRPEDYFTAFISASTY